MRTASRRRFHHTYLSVAVLQILTTLLRQVFDFLGPLWTLILFNFLTIVFSIFGFYGAVVRRGGYLLAYSLFNAATTCLNVLVVLLYTHPGLAQYKSPILSLHTGALSYFETRAPGCVPDWSSNTIYNCTLDPTLVECGQAVVQIILSLVGILAASALICSSQPDEKQLPPEPADPRPMTPRRVKRRSARSIQSNNYGRSSRSSRRSLQQYKSPVNRLIDSETSHDERERVWGVQNRGYQPGPPAVVANSIGSHRRSRSQQRQSTLQSQHRQHPSHLQNQLQTLAPPNRPPSARSSYSNYHPARVLHGSMNPSFEPEYSYYNGGKSVYPLAHSPVSQESYPMHAGGPGHWGAMGQVPVAQQQQHNSETVI